MSTATKTKAAESPVEPTIEAQLSGGTQQIPVNKISVVGKHDRQGKTDEQLGIAELAESISISGLQQPIMVVPIKGGEYNLVFGERRLRAVRELGWKSIAAIVRDDSGKSEANAAEDVAESRAVENIHRLDPTPIGEAVAIADLFNVRMRSIEREYSHADPGKEKICVSAMAKLRAQAIDQTAEQLGKPVAWVRDRMYLAGFSGPARELITEGKLPLMHAREIAKVADPATRDDLARRYAAGGKSQQYDRREKWQAGSIEELKKEVARNLYSLSTVPWNLNVPFDAKPACVECPFNSLNSPGLFEGKQLFVPDAKSKGKVGRYNGPPAKPEPSGGVCTRPSCYMDKTSFSGRALSGAATKVINKWEPAKAAKEKGAAKLLELTAIKQVTPSFIDPTAVRERVQERMKSHRSKASVGAEGDRPSADDSPRNQATRRGESAYFAAARTWKDKKAIPSLATYLAKVPGRFAMFALAQRTKPFERASHYNAKEKDFKSADFLRLIRLVEKPSLESAIEFEKACGTKVGLFDPPYLDDIEEECIAEILKALNVEIAPPPVKQAFIDAELAKLKKPAPTDKKTPAKKRSTGAEHGDVREDGE